MPDISLLTTTTPIAFCIVVILLVAVAAFSWKVGTLY